MIVHTKQRSPLRCLYANFIDITPHINLAQYFFFTLYNQLCHHNAYNALLELSDGCYLPSVLTWMKHNANTMYMLSWVRCNAKTLSYNMLSYGNAKTLENTTAAPWLLYCILPVCYNVVLYLHLYFCVQTGWSSVLYVLTCLWLLKTGESKIFFFKNVFIHIHLYIFLQISDLSEVIFFSNCEQLLYFLCKLPCVHQHSTLKTPSIYCIMHTEFFQWIYFVNFSAGAQ